jgi:hypothetical protein
VHACKIIVLHPLPGDRVVIFRLFHRTDCDGSNFVAHAAKYALHRHVTATATATATGDSTSAAETSGAAQTLQLSR